MKGDARFEAFAQKYIQELLDRDPETATRLGEHRNDARLNDYSAEGVRKDLAAARSALVELSRIDLSTLSAEDAVDARILKNRLDSQIYELATIRGWEWNPLQYNVGGAIHALISREFAPPEQRLRSVIGRLKGVPGVVAAAKANLKMPPRIHTETAIQQNKGTVRLVKEQLDRCRTPEEARMPLLTPQKSLRVGLEQVLLCHYAESRPEWRKYLFVGNEIEDGQLKRA